MAKMRNVILYSSIILLMALIIVFAALYTPTNNSGSKNKSSGSGTDNPDYTGEVQNVKLMVSGSKYILVPAVLKKDVPVRLEADLSSVRGCARDIVIAEFGIHKYVTSGDNIITFTPTKTGTINIACSMNMYRGTFTVE